MTESVESLKKDKETNIIENKMTKEIKNDESKNGSVQNTKQTKKYIDKNIVICSWMFVMFACIIFDVKDASESGFSWKRFSESLAMALKTLHSIGQRLPRGHNVRFHGDDLPKYKSLDTTDSSSPGYAGGPQSLSGIESGTTSSDSCIFQPAMQRFRYNEQRIKLLSTINQIVQQRADLESNKSSLNNLVDELRRKLKSKIEDCHYEKKENLKALRQANTRLEKEKYSIISEIEHLQRHLEKEEAHHVQHARTAVVQAIQGVTKMTPTDQLFSPCSVSELPNVVCRNVARNAPSRLADNKLAAARLMRDIAELRTRVQQVESRLTLEMKRKRQAENDIVRLRKQLSATKSCIASLRLPTTPLRKQCSKFA